MRALSRKAPLRVLWVPLALSLFTALFPAFSDAAEVRSSQVEPVRPKAPAAPPAQNLSAPGCEPCPLSIGRNLSPFEVRFEARKTDDGRRVVEELRISRAGKPGWSQSLPVYEMAPLPDGQEFFLGAADINFDGFNDLFFATSRGVANTYVDYWLFRPRKQAFSYLGNYPIFTVDARKKVLTAYERGGHGGLIYQAKSYRFIKGALTLVRSEIQEATDEEGIYRRSVFLLKDGKLRLIERKTVRGPASK